MDIDVKATNKPQTIDEAVDLIIAEKMKRIRKLSVKLKKNQGEMTYE